MRINEMGNYILDGHIPVVEPDLMKWAEWFETAKRVDSKSAVGEIKVSTIFLGVDHSFMDSGPPILFETMVFGGSLDQEMNRCSTWDEAEKMHERMCVKVKLECQL